MRDMTAADVQAPAREHNLRYHDGTSRRVFVTEVETPFPAGELIVSQTDPAGIITMCNDAFVLMSGYSREELLGTPHHILRQREIERRQGDHAVAFGLMADTGRTEIDHRSEYRIVGDTQAQGADAAARRTGAQAVAADPYAGILGPDTAAQPAYSQLYIDRGTQAGCNRRGLA